MLGVIVVTPLGIIGRALAKISSPLKAPNRAILNFYSPLSEPSWPSADSRQRPVRTPITEAGGSPNMVFVPKRVGRHAIEIRDGLASAVRA